MSSYMDDFQPDYDPSIEAESSMSEPAKPYTWQELVKYSYDPDGSVTDDRIRATAEYIRDLEAQVARETVLPRKRSYPETGKLIAKE